MIEITRGDNNTFSITQDGETTVYSAVFFAKSKSQSVYLFPKYAHPGFSFGARYDEITVGGVSYASAQEVVAALSEFVGSFGSGAPSPIPLQTKNVSIAENGTTEITPDTGFGGLSKVIVETEVQGGTSNALMVASEDWAEADLPEELQVEGLTVKAAAGRLYFGSNAIEGVWMFDKTSRSFTKIYETGTGWNRWFEASAGDVYVSSDNSGAGILRVSGDTVTQIYTLGAGWQYWFETSAGDVYVSSYNSGAGILRVSGDTATQIYTLGAGWQYWFETSTGDVYASASGGSGILKVSGSTVAQIYASNNSWQYWFETSTGDVYASASGSSGILKVSGSTTSKIYSSSNSWRYWFETSTGEVYVSSPNVAGVFKISGSTVTQIYTSGWSWQYWFETSAGDVYVSSGFEYDILKLVSSTVTQINTPAPGWGFWAETSAGKVYVGSFSELGVLRIEGSIATWVCKRGGAYVQRSGDILVPEEWSSVRYPFDMSTEALLDFPLGGALIGQWVFSSGVFSMVTKQLPTTSYIPKKYIVPAASVDDSLAAVDSLGNVFVVGSGSVIYSKNPIAA